MSEIINYSLFLFAKMGYAGVLILMSIESSFIPLPSEIVIPPAAYLASRGEMNIFLIILIGTAGSMIGASINYWLADWLGRKIVYALADHRFAKIFLIKSKHIEEAEKYFLEYGNISTFLGRLLPGIRHLISLPAGFSRMPFKDFLLYTFLGSFLWVSILSTAGYLFGANQALLEEYYKVIIEGVVIFSIFSGLAFFVWRRRRKKRELNTNPNLNQNH